MAKVRVQDATKELSANAGHLLDDFVKLRKQSQDVLSSLGVDCGRISLNDKGAIDCVIRARVETAVRRAGGEN